MKQRITAIAAKFRRHQGWVDSYRQNRLFENNQGQFYRELDQEEERYVDDQPVAEESNQLWETYGVSLQSIRSSKWLQDFQSEINVKKQEKIDITTGSLEKILPKISN